MPAISRNRFTPRATDDPLTPSMRQACLIKNGERLKFD
jgi:hypothetical protein